MADDSKRSRKAGDLAHNIWLAGLGAYGRAWDGAQDTLKRVEKGSSAVFDELVAKGETIEKQAEQTVKKVARSAENFSIEDRINRIRENFGLTTSLRSDEKLDQIIIELAALQKKMNTLTKEVRKLQKNDA